MINMTARVIALHDSPHFERANTRCERSTTDARIAKLSGSAVPSPRDYHKQPHSMTEFIDIPRHRTPKIIRIDDSLASVVNFRAATRFPELDKQFEALERIKATSLRRDASQHVNVQTDFLRPELRLRIFNGFYNLCACVPPYGVGYFENI